MNGDSSDIARDMLQQSWQQLLLCNDKWLDQAASIYADLIIRKMKVIYLLFNVCENQYE